MEGTGKENTIIYSRLRSESCVKNSFIWKILNGAAINEGKGRRCFE
jgi:hypothetical protein